MLIPLVCVLATLRLASPSAADTVYELGAPADDIFAIEIQRQSDDGELITGTIRVNGVLLGTTYENSRLKVKAGSYAGIVRYTSPKGFVQGPFGNLGQVGDFLLEIQDAVKDVDNAPMTDVLFHGGVHASESKGCIMLGPVSRSCGQHCSPVDGIKWVNDGDPLRKLRKMFYQTEFPTQPPTKNITIHIVDPPE